MCFFLSLGSVSVCVFSSGNSMPIFSEKNRVCGVFMVSLYYIAGGHIISREKNRRIKYTEPHNFYPLNEEY